jgi:membrane fusion protein (multidrug efflux system)
MGGRIMDIPANQRAKNLMKLSRILAILMAPVCLSISACHDSHAEEKHEEEHKIIVTNPLSKDVTITQPYVSQIRSRTHINVCALVGGYLEEIPVKEGQSVKKGDVMFKILPVLYQARYESELAEYQVALQEYENTKRLFEQSVPGGGTTGLVSQRELNIFKAKMAKAEANVNKAKAELSFATIRAPFDGIVDQQQMQVGNAVKEGEILTTLSDNSVMWVKFNVTEGRYFEFMAGLGDAKSLPALQEWMNKNARIEIMLADGSKFKQTGTLASIGADFNNGTGNVTFRADFPNPSHLLRNGQTGTILVNLPLHDVTVIPQRATFEILDKRYVYVVDEDKVVHQRQITVLHEMDDIFVIKNGIGVNDRIILEGIRQVHDGEKLKEFEYCKPEECIAHQKNKAE